MKNEITDSKIEPTTFIEELCRDLKTNQTYSVNFMSRLEDVPDPRDLDKTKKNLMIFDDLQLEKQNTCEKYYV
jgi:hypothetical protein